MTTEKNSDRYAAFLSYVRADDDHDDGHITTIRRRLAAEIQMQTGDVFPIFQDREDILIGQRWRDRIQTSIDDTTLLITFITPSFLKSEACREEVGSFLTREQGLGRDDLIIPVLYLPTPGLQNETDQIASNLASRQYFNWAELRFEDPNSNEVRKATATLAQQVVRAIERSRSSFAINVSKDAAETEDSLGFVELLAEAEHAMPAFGHTIKAFEQSLRSVTAVTASSTAELDSANQSNKPSSAKLAAIRRLAKKLEEPVVEMEILAEDYIDQLNKVGGGINALISRVPGLSDTDDVEGAENMLLSLGILVEAAGSGLGSLEEFRQSLESNHALSSTLRPVFKRMSGAIRKLVPSEQVFKGWHDDLAEAISERQHIVTEGSTE